MDMINNSSSMTPLHREAIAALYEAMARSEHVAYVAQCRALVAGAFFPLAEDEISQLKQQGNTADDWSHIYKTQREPSLHTGRVRDCRFQGRVVLGQFTGHRVLPGGVALPSGCYRSTLRNAVVMHDALVQDTLALSDTLVDTQACVISCGCITGVISSATTQPSANVHSNDNGNGNGNGMTLSVGVETGGRNLRVFAELPFDLAATLIGERAPTELHHAYDTFVEHYTLAVACPFMIIGRHAQVMRCAHVSTSFVGCYAQIDDADVVHSTLLSTREEPCIVANKSSVRNSLLQWHVTVKQLSVVSGCLLGDSSHVTRRGAVSCSMLGPNTSISEGEVSSCLVGPFVGFHHQALLIACVWPGGRGNVGYGANVGSNHTLKAPDQEFMAGEGLFFGLGCSIKYPSHFTHAPYSVIATGVTTLPQRMEMPFALINVAGHNISALSPAINEISPGWVLAHSVFTVLRNEHKFLTRNHSKRTLINASIFHSKNVAYMKEARRRLIAAAGSAKLALPNGEAIYTDKQVRGLGKNYMRESARIDAVNAYSFFIQLAALDGLLAWRETLAGKRDLVPMTVDALPSCPDSLITVKEEFASDMMILDALKTLVEKRHSIVTTANKQKARDDARGKRIIPDYELVHSPIEDEAAIRYAQRIAVETEARVAHFMAKL